MINKKLIIGVDIDGVLGDQVTPILREINKKYQTNYTKEDIIEWDYPIEDTDIETEINNALKDKEYILNMPVIDGAKIGMSYLYDIDFSY